MLPPSGNPFKCHEEVLNLQPMIPPKRFDIFPPDWGMRRRSRRVQIFLEISRLCLGYLTLLPLHDAGIHIYAPISSMAIPQQSTYLAYCTQIIEKKEEESASVFGYVLEFVLQNILRTEKIDVPQMTAAHKIRPQRRRGIGRAGPFSR